MNAVEKFVAMHDIKNPSYVRVIEYMMEGYSYVEIAKRMGMTHYSVRQYAYYIFKITKLNSRSKLMSKIYKIAEGGVG